MADYVIKQNDSWPPITFTLSDAGGPVNLTTATEVKLIARKQDQSLTITGICVQGNQGTNPGQASYTFLAADTASIGSYDLEFQVNWGGSPAKIETFPNVGYKSLDIVDDLG